MSESESFWKILEFKSRASRTTTHTGIGHETNVYCLMNGDGCRVLNCNGQATKGSRWIPRHTEAMKDVVTCDKSRGAGNTL